MGGGGQFNSFQKYEKMHHTGCQVNYLPRDYLKIFKVTKHCNKNRKEKQKRILKRCRDDKKRTPPHTPLRMILSGKVLRTEIYVLAEIQLSWKYTTVTQLCNLFLSCRWYLITYRRICADIRALIKRTIYKYIVEMFQNLWNSCPNKLYKIKPNIGEWIQKHEARREEVIMSRVYIGTVV